MWMRPVFHKTGRTILFDSGFPDMAIEPVTIPLTTSATSVTALPTPPPRQGYGFGGWYPAGNPVPSFGIYAYLGLPTEDNITYAAIWKRTSTIFTLDVMQPGVEDYSYETNRPYYYMPQPLPPPHMYFRGWSYQRDTWDPVPVLGTYVDPVTGWETDYEMVFTVLPPDMTLYAFYLDDGTGDRLLSYYAGSTLVAQQSISAGDRYVPPNIPASAIPYGMKFDGWKTTIYEPGWGLASVLLDTSGMSGSNKITFDDRNSTVVNAQFVLADPDQIPITFSIAGGQGHLNMTINGHDVPWTSPMMVSPGSDLSFESQPAADYQIKQWTDNGNTVGGLALSFEIFDITEPHNVTVTFERPLIFSNPGGYDIPSTAVGTAITPIDVSGLVQGGEPPYKFASAGIPWGISIDSATGVISGAPTTPNAATTVTLIVTDSVGAYAGITINCGIIYNLTYPLIVKSGPGGTVSGAVSGVYAAGDVLNVTAIPDPGYYFGYWAIYGGEYAGSYMFVDPRNPAPVGIASMGTAPMTYEAYFAAVTDVTVSPASAEVQQGGSRQFAAEVQGMYNPLTDVTWSVSGGTGSTAIDASGLLTVDAAQPAGSILMVTATSTVDSTQSGAATVTVTATPPPPVYAISLSHGSFADGQEGYATPPALAVTVTNTGNQATGDLSITLTGAYATEFVVSPGSTISSISTATPTASFAVSPIPGLVAGTYTATVTVSGANVASQQFAVSFTVKAVLTGVATIDNTSPRIGDTLTAALTGSNNTGTLTYTWKARGVILGTGASYTVQAGDLGEEITVEVTSSAQAGAVTGVAGTALKKAAPAAPGAPTLVSKTYNSVTLAANALYEFSKDGIVWQTSNVFTFLNVGTGYTFYQRVAATADTEASPASAGLGVITSAIFTVTFDGNGGLTPAPRGAVEGMPVGTMPTTLRAGYAFAGWFTDPDGGTQIDASTIIAGNITCYAHWLVATGAATPISTLGQWPLALLALLLLAGWAMARMRKYK